ncbi:MAG: hypothetical protein M1820_000513 [Bogoriella megaspora]|nr:MAG: hypothetical protein M1820_000513 [Bogoriella megaspora]
MAEEECQELQNPGPSIFDAVRFTIIPSDTLDSDYTLELIELLEAHGARCVPLNKYGRINDVKLCTHIISTTSDFPDYDNAVDNFVPVVRPLWIESCVQKKRLVPVKAFNPDPSLFFTGITITCAEDIPEGDKNAIIGGVLAMGGAYSQILSTAVTHVVALTLDNKKCHSVEKKDHPCRIVLPHWFDDCLKLRRRLDEEPYLLPDPDILRPHNDKAVLDHKENQNVAGICNKPSNEGLPEIIAGLSSSSPSKSRKILRAFAGRHLMLSEDLDISPHLRTALEDIIRSSDGYITGSVTEADTFVCQYRDGSDYIRASRSGKDVGTLIWLYHMIAVNKWTNPTNRLLHYPIPRDGLDGLRDLRISVSNYSGDARSYLQQLIAASGAEFTKTMGQNNTHLITGHRSSEKCDAAREWNVNIVNHLWLEESYAKEKIQTLTDSRYTHFPERSNLGEVVGQTGIDKTVVKQNYWDTGLEKSPRKVKSNAGNVARKQLPKKAPTTVGNGTTIEGSSFADETDMTADNARTTPLVNKAKDARNTALPLRTPGINRTAPGKENETPSTTHSRGAKDRAVSKMHDLAPDIALYEKEMKRKGGVIHGRDKTTEPEKSNVEKGAAKVRKRTYDEAVSEDEDDEAATPSPTKEQSKPKKAKLQLPPIDHRMLLTGANEYTDDDKKGAALKARLRSMGILLTTNPAEASILCAPKVVRTRKFVAALASAPLVVSTSYLDYCLKHDSPPDAAKHALGNDRDTKEQFGFFISHAVGRAKMNDRRLLRGWTIFCTEAVNGGFDTYKEIIYLNGGQCLLWKGRSSITVTRRKPGLDAREESQNQGGEEEEDVLYLLSGTAKGEKALWSKFRALAEKHDMRPRIVKPEWLLVCAMAQQIERNDKFELSESSS